MEHRKPTKINLLLQKWPYGTIVVQAWLEQQGISRNLAHVYQIYQWLQPVGRGIYIRPNDQIDWTGAVFALQQELDLEIHVGATTALAMLGYSHNIQLQGKEHIWLMKPYTEKRHTPTWFKKYMFQNNITYITKTLFTKWQLGFKDLAIKQYSVKISSAERAIIECLYLTPKYLNLQDVAILMEKLRTLRPRLLQDLLEACTSYKTKRLFLYLAEVQQHSWYKKLNLDNINLGKGKISIIPGGKFITKYNMTIEDLNNHEGYNIDAANV